MTSIFLLIIVLLACAGVEISSAEHNLTIMLITSFGEFGFNSSGAIPAADVALEGINGNNSMLPGYRLVYDKPRNSQCHRGYSLDAFFDALHSDTTYIAIVGCGCAPATEPVAEISHRWNISQISFASGSTALSDRNRFKRYFRNSLTFELLAPALHSMLDHFKWRRIAVLTQDENLFTGTESTFIKELRPANITVETQLFPTKGDPVETVDDFFLEKQDYRVFFLNSYTGPAKKIICEAISRNLTYPNYAWIMYDWYPKKWWKDIDESVVKCKADEIEKFLDKVLTLRRYPETDDISATTQAGISQMEFVAKYENRTTSEYDRVLAGVMYDVIWVLAMALNETMTMINHGDISQTGCVNASGDLVPLEQFNYTNEKIGCLVQWNLQRTHFDGVSGTVRFDENGTRIYPQVRLKQYIRQGGTLIRKRLAYLEQDTTNNTVTFTFEDGIHNLNVFPDGIPPDGTPIQSYHTFETSLIALFDILAAIGLLFTVVCLLFNVIFRNRRVVKLSSPNLNNFIIAGAALMYISIIFHLLPSTNSTFVLARCMIEHGLLIIGYSLAFGAVLAKMWRVYQVFHNPTPNKKIFHDGHLILIVLAITGISVLMLLLEFSIPMLRGTPEVEVDREHPSGHTPLGVREEFYVLECYEASSPTFFWQITIFVYLAILQVVGILLAFQTRRVKMKGLNDSKLVATIIYISSIVLVALGLVKFGLRAFINVGTGITVAGIFTLSTIILGLNFVPKMILLYKDPKGKSIGSTTKAASVVGNAVSQMDTTYHSDWEKKIASLEKALRERDAKIALLMKSQNCSEKELEANMLDENLS